MEGGTIRHRLLGTGPATAFVTAVTICVAAYVVLFLLILGSPAEAVFDERALLLTLDILRHDGVTIDFFRELPGAPGPTFTLVYGAVQSVFHHLALPWLRFVNFALMSACVALIYALFRLTKLELPSLSRPQSAVLAAAMFAALPTVPVSSGMALSEIPAAFFAMIFVVAAHFAIRGGGRAIPRSILAGVALGAAILGRQNYLVLLPAMVLLPEWPPRTAVFLPLAITAAVAAFLFGPVFLIWGGLLPPQAVSLGSHYLPFHVVLSLGYIGLITALITPDIYSSIVKHRYDLWFILALALLTMVTFATPSVPMHTFVERLWPNAEPLLGWTFALTVSIIAFAFVAATLRLWMQNHRAPLVPFGVAAVLMGAFSNIRIYQFSSRYILIFLPFLLLAIARHVRVSWHLPLRLALGSGIGLASLASFYR